MATEKGYQGWANYETWAAALWIDNDRGEYERWREEADRWLAELGHESEGDTYSDATVALAEQMKEEFEQDLARHQESLGATMWSDLLGAAFAEIEWREIADSMLDALVE